MRVELGAVFLGWGWGGGGGGKKTAPAPVKTTLAALRAQRRRSGALGLRHHVAKCALFSNMPMATPKSSLKFPLSAIIKINSGRIRMAKE